MKKIQQEVKTYKNIYVSVDGKEFENEADCRAWENSYKGTIEASWKLIKKVEVGTPELGLPWSSDDHECYLVKPKNLDEITLINAYIASSTYDDRAVLTIEHIGKLIALDFGYDHDYCSAHILSEHINKITSYIAEREKELNEGEDEENE